LGLWRDGDEESKHVELISLRLGHDHVVRLALQLLFAYHSRPSGGQSLDRLDCAGPPHLRRCVAASADLDVEVQPVLHHFRLRHLQERQVRAHPIRIGERCALRTPSTSTDVLAAGVPVFLVSGRSPVRSRPEAQYLPGGRPPGTPRCGGPSPPTPPAGGCSEIHTPQARPRSPVKPTAPGNSVGRVHDGQPCGLTQCRTDPSSMDPRSLGVH
jgi:hypothetical protein